MKEAWLGTGKYKERVITVDEKSGLVFVHSGGEVRWNLMVFTRPPEDGGDGFQFWVASCDPFAESCIIRLFLHDVYVDFRIPVTEIHLALEFRQRVRKLLES